VKPEARTIIPAVTHADGTARLQTVHREHATPFRRLIEAFDALTGVPVLLNTSFNRRSEPIVSSPNDALQTFLWSGLDYLIMGRILVKKELPF
jgi:carbamoyltransferase